MARSCLQVFLPDVSRGINIPLAKLDPKRERVVSRIKITNSSLAS